MYKVDAKGLVCPKPVILAKKALIDYDEIVVEVDNPTSMENLEKMAIVMGLECHVEANGGVYAVNMKKTAKFQPSASEKTKDEYIVVISSEFAGTGDDTLGEALLKSFIYALAESETLPSAVICYNGGVKLTCEGSAVLEDFNRLKAAGVEILSCGTCLNYYGLTEKLAVGTVTNMYVILERQQRAAKVIRP